MGDTTETNKKVLSGESFLGVVALQTPILKNNYMRKMGPFPQVPSHTHTYRHLDCCCFTPAVHARMGKPKKKKKKNIEIPCVVYYQWYLSCTSADFCQVLPTIGCYV